MTFGPDLLMSAKFSARHSPKIGMAWPPWAVRSQHHSVASLIKPIWRIFKGAKLSASRSPKIGMAWPPWAIRSQHHSVASLIRPIWRIFKGLEAADMVS
jgi:hypothetical protein